MSADGKALKALKFVELRLRLFNKSQLIVWCDWAARYIVQTQEIAAEAIAECEAEGGAE